MDFGLPISGSVISGQAANFADYTFAMFLYQSGGALYNEEGTRSAVDSDLSVALFRDFTKYWTDYKLPNPFDFANRFRSGEMPLAIADYTEYNRLQVFAPEIRGLWGFTLVPGTPHPDGTIDHSVPTAGLATVIMDRSRDHNAAWEFVKWWTSAETQTRFGQGMETLMGPAARYPTANQEAFAMLPWPVEDFRQIQSQFVFAKGIPQVPGGYFTQRQINNAFHMVVTEERMGPREALTEATRYINDEIAYKRNEFGLD
jgi:ABC-type glycerol-3-phosphate transport system substrate-binding protein